MSSKEAPQTQTNWVPSANDGDAGQCCGNCGAHVTPQFARVFGDNSDNVNACPNCTTYRKMGTAAIVSND